MIQAQAPRACSGAFKTTPAPSLQVMMRDMPRDFIYIKYVCVFVFGDAGNV